MQDKAYFSSLQHLNDLCKALHKSLRFVKQTYDLDNISVLKYVRLKNMMALLLTVFYFVAIILDQSQKLTIMAGHVLKWGKSDLIIKQPNVLLNFHS